MSEALCCQWSMSKFFNSSASLASPTNTRSTSVTKTEFQEVLSTQAAAESWTNPCSGNSSLNLSIVSTCYDTLEAIMPPSQRITPSRGAVVGVVLLLTSGSAVNLLVLTALLLFGKVRRKKGAFALNLTAVDTLVLLLCAPCSLSLALSADYHWGFVLCRLLPFLQGSLVSISVWSQASVALCRYVVICHPIQFRSIFTTRRIAKWIVGIWTLSLLICAPTAATHRFVDEQMLGIFRLRYCIEDDSNLLSNIYTVALTILHYLLPVVLIASLCIVTTRALHQSQQFPTASATQAAKRNRQLVEIRRFVAMLVTFAICWGPFHIFVLVSHLRRNRLREQHESETSSRLISEILKIVKSSLVALGYLNSVINPCVQLYFSSELRAHCWSLITAPARCCTKSRPSSDQGQSAEDAVEEMAGETLDCNAAEETPV